MELSKELLEETKLKLLADLPNKTDVYSTNLKSSGDQILKLSDMQIENYFRRHKTEIKDSIEERDTIPNLSVSTALKMFEDCEEMRLDRSTGASLDSSTDSKDDANYNTLEWEFIHGDDIFFEERRSRYPQPIGPSILEFEGEAAKGDDQKKQENYQKFEKESDVSNKSIIATVETPDKDEDLQQKFAQLDSENAESLSSNNASIKFSLKYEGLLMNDSGWTNTSSLQCLLNSEEGGITNEIKISEDYF